MKKSLLFAVLTAGLLTACTQENAFEPTLQTKDHITVNAQIEGFVPAAETRTVINPADYSCTWKSGDKIGMFSNHIDGDTQTPSQLGLSLYTGNGTSEAIFTGSTGWKMNANGEYNYVAYYPYGEKNTRENVVLDYTGQTQVANNSTAHLGDYDFMYSTATMPSNAEEIAFSFSHINALANFKMTIPEEYQDHKFGKIRICAEEDIFTTQATYDIQNLIANGKPTITPAQTDSKVDMEFGNEGISDTDGTLDAWLMMLPTQWNGKEITIKLYDIFTAIPLLEGKFTASSNQQSSMTYSYNVTLSKYNPLPDKPKEGEQLHILLFGHSFGVDCTEYLPAITKAAGVTDVHYGRFFQGNCSLEGHYRHLVENTSYSYQNCPANSTSWTSIDRYIEDVIKETPWDIVIFQQNLEYSGIYSKYQPYLNSLVSYVKTTCEQTHNKVPIIGWNMFWPISRLAESGGSSTLTYRLSFYNNSSEQMYQAYCSATQEMMNDTGIELVIPSGTTIQNLRTTNLNTKIEYEFTRDMYHMSYGIGRYAAACTWFQTLIAPIYKIDIEGNSYRPTSSSNADDKVTDAKTATIWQCVKAALAHPFEVTTIEE